MIHKHAKSHSHPDVPKKSGFVTDDWMVSKNELSTGIDNERYCMFAYDLGTHFVMACPKGCKDTIEAFMSLKHYAGQQNVIRFYSDGGGELVSAAKALKLNRDRSLLHSHSNNGISERRNRIGLEGTRTVLMRAGMPTSLWPCTVRHFCFAQNIAAISGNPETAPCCLRYSSCESKHAYVFLALCSPALLLRPKYRRNIWKPRDCAMMPTLWRILHWSCYSLWSSGIVQTL